MSRAISRTKIVSWDRWQVLIAFAQKRRLSQWKLGTRLRSVWYEFHTAETAALSKLVATSSVKDAAFGAFGSSGTTDSGR